VNLCGFNRSPKREASLGGKVCGTRVIVRSIRVA
jgi:hypothetical protein